MRWWDVLIIKPTNGATQSEVEFKGCCNTPISAVQLQIKLSQLDMLVQTIGHFLCPSLTKICSYSPTPKQIAKHDQHVRLEVSIFECSPY